ncbi:hypothetical protein [Nitrospirillum iridis]|uniref:Uncharacterized protein n=1 Tax=Nitrospirillum iridis TaxID=765888 RepID=A0A7X0EEV9_9PROT|nr:hypothetical protein [Nitrospirillum iridis]MBB6254293.1 hypothetical protein [Nitrospirillum iridis]
MGSGVVRRWGVVIMLGGLVALPQAAWASAGLGLEMVCADAVNAAPPADRVPPFARLLGLLPAHPEPVPALVCLAGYRSLWAPKSADEVAKAPAPPAASAPLAIDGRDDGRRALGVYTRYTGALLSGLPADIAIRREEVGAAALTRLRLIGQGLAAGAHRPIAILQRPFRDPSALAPVRVAHLLRPDTEAQSP